jgi:hypothetical protein
VPDANNQHATHVSDEMLADYSAGRLSELDELEVEEHLADCSACAAVARAALLVEDVWDTWTARAHGQAYLAEVLAQAVIQAERLTADPSWKARLGAWAAQWRGHAEGAVRVVLDATGAASHVVTEGLDGLTRPGASWQFAPIPVAVPTRGPRAGGAPSRPTVALAPGSQQARVAVGGARREIVVRIDGQPADRRPPLVLLVPLDNDVQPRLAVVESQPDLPYLLARFADVPVGEYVVAFEPFADA